MEKEELKERMRKSFFLSKLLFLYQKTMNKRDFMKRKKLGCSEAITLFHDAKKGKRCFIIGNGPSLTIEDLDRIKEEDSFAVNRIYKIFDKTEWRPTYYVCQDRFVVNDVNDDLGFVIKECDYTFLNNSVVLKNKTCINQSNVFYVFLDDRNRYPEMPLFSEDISKVLYEGNTVTYTCIQIAVYMGYSEIYLLGIDHNYSKVILNDGTVREDKEIQNYMPGLEGAQGFLPALDKTELAYQKARIICEEKGVQILNATRGGKLEVFKRTGFDSLFPKEE